MIKKPDFKRIAKSVYEGAGSFRSHEMIQRDILQALEAAYLAGQTQGKQMSRLSLLSEHASIVAGMKQSLDSKARVLEQEIEALTKVE